VRTKLDDDLMAVAAIMASAVGWFAYLHLNRAASTAISESRPDIASQICFQKFFKVLRKKNIFIISLHIQIGLEAIF
jgi:hypothetical protein